VPYALDAPLARSGMLTPGAAARYFMAVPEGSAGLRVRIDLDGRGGSATLYLFEPDGRPHRGGSSVVAGTGQRSAEIVVSAEDLVAGTYEAVIVAPPTQSVAFRLMASVPAVRVLREPGEPAVMVENPTHASLAVSASAFAVGSRREHRVSATPGHPGLVTFVVPDGAGTLALEASMGDELWRRLTDFGVTVFDRWGRKLSDGPLHYPLGRQALDLKSVTPGDTVVIELLPAFADPADEGTWEARLRTDALFLDPVPLAMAGQGAEPVGLRAGERARMAFAVPADSTLQAVPFGTIVEIRLDISDGTQVRSLTAVGR